jgi:iron complex transport system ATP-binding protein
MISVTKLCCGYAGNEVLRDLDLELSERDFAVLAGPNGAGKSTLVYALLGFLKPLRGVISLFGKPLGAYRRSDLARLIAFVPQESVFQFDYTVTDIVLMGRYPYQGLMQTWLPRDHEVVAGVLERLGLGALAQRYFSQLSGGEKQRVLIARALAQETRYIFLDETLSQLDINHQIEIMGILRKINSDQGIGVLLISHNLNLGANFADKMVFLSQGRVLGSGSPAEMMRPELLSSLFGMELETMLNPSSGQPNLIYPGR